MGSWLRRLSIPALLGFPVAVLGVRFGAYEFGVGFAIIKYSFFLAAGIFVIALIVWLVQRNSNPASSRAAAMAAIICLIPVAALGSQIIKARSLPFIHNISTDVVNPPNFNKIIELRGQNSNSIEYDAEQYAKLQQGAYPNVKTLLVNLSVAQAHAKALDVVDSLGWELVHHNPAVGSIEATETTALWAFKDDVVIRIVAQGNKTAIDLRSVSRVGQSDLGANARRIEKFLAAFKH